MNDLFSKEMNDIKKQRELCKRSRLISKINKAAGSNQMTQHKELIKDQVNGELMKRSKHWVRFKEQRKWKAGEEQEEVQKNPFKEQWYSMSKNPLRALQTVVSGTCCAPVITFAAKEFRLEIYWEKKVSHRAYHIISHRVLLLGTERRFNKSSMLESCHAGRRLEKQRL